MAGLQEVQRELRGLGDKAHARVMQRFFKTGPGEYGEGDRFVGVKVPQVRKLAKRHRDLNLSTVEKLLRSPVHEERLLALFVLNLQFQRGGETETRRIYDLYVGNVEHINNWDLVDGSAGHIIGGFLEDKDRKLLHRWAKARNLWKRRIAIMSTFPYIRAGQFEDTLAIAEALIHDEHDLIHKAVGWMLREVGKRDARAEEQFLRKNYEQMPRTMLRYAIERFPERKRKAYLQGKM